MNFDLGHIWQEMDIFARLVVMTLATMATASLAVFFERLWYFQRARARSVTFGDRARRLIAERAYGDVIREGKAVVGAPLAKVLAVGLETYGAAQAKPNLKLTPVELTRRELERLGEALGGEIRRGFNVLASVGSVAPFVGLLGTVVGIIASFPGIAREGSGGIGAVSAGIAEALVVTAFGLLVAIPAVLAFNWLSARADALTLAVEQAKGELVDHLEAEAPAVKTVAAPDAASPVTREALGAA
jgi:biopolymer transport protein ExbB